MIISKDKFYQEQSDIINTILDNRFFKPWKEYSKFGQKNDYNHSLISESHLELYITSSCNQNCDYCYLVKYPELYPAEFNKKSLVLNNLDILLNWVIENNYYIPRIEIFSGEIWDTNYGLEVLEKIYNAIAFNGLQTDMILIPSNCSFILDPIQTHKIQHWINAYQKIGIRLCFSISVDGKYIEDFRPLNNSDKEKNGRFYEDLFLFAAHNKYYFHPMISSTNVNKWIDNFKWFEEMHLKYEMNVETMMMLEVRNDGWDEKSISDYINFIDFLIDRKFKQCNNNSKTFFDFLFNLKLNNDDCASGYIPYAITFADTFPGCTVCDSLTVRLGDLAICPCHRQAYNKLLYGHFVIENNKITGIKGQNPELASRILLGNNNLCSIGCDSCLYKKVCLKGCFGSQYEIEKDPFFPIESVCNFFKAKWNFLTKRYLDLGILTYLKDISPYSLHYNKAKELINYFEGVKQYVE